MDETAIQSTLTDLLASKDNLTSHDYAFLANYQQNDTYVKIYKENLLINAENKIFADPARSVKYDQYLAFQAIFFQ